MSIWTDNIMTISPDGEKDTTIDKIRNIDVAVDTDNTRKTTNQTVLSQNYDFDHIESLPLPEGYETKNIVQNTSNANEKGLPSQKHIYGVRRHIVENIQTSPTDIPSKSSARTFFESLGAYIPRWSRSSTNNHQHTFNSSAPANNIESCEVLENFNAMSSPVSSTPVPPLSHKRLHISNRNIPITNHNSDNSSDNTDSGNSSKHLCSKIGEDELILGTKCDRDINCDSAMVELRKEQPVVVTRNDGTVSAVTAAAACRSSFILPRVNLKTSANSIISGTGVAANTTTAIINNENSGFERCYEKSGRERVSSSHYSTEKSGSSGYYSSNIYSTSSFDEHIYSEPVNDGTSNGCSDAVGNAVHSNAPCVGVVASECDAIIAKAELGEPQLRQINGQQRQSQGLVNLEASIKNLEMHLKAFNRPGPSDFDDVCLENTYGLVDNKYDKRKSVRLPTIMEGVDGTQAVNIPTACRNFQEDPDDSLMDLDLDSFLLANEVRDKMKSANSTATTNVSFDNSIVSSDFIENNYKCRKYVNSCPDDAYNVEGIIEEPQPSSSIDKSLALYLKRCDDQVHSQNTKDILEEIRAKLNALLSATPSTNSHNPFVTTDEDRNIGNSSVLQQNIQSLKSDVDNYLSLMNKSNEMEIKQFCTGLSKNYKLLTIQNALENRQKDMKCSDIVCNNYEVPHKQYELVPVKKGLSSYREREESQFDTVYVRDGFSFGYKSKDPFHLDFNQVSPAEVSLTNFQLPKLKCSPCSSCEEMRNNSFSDVTTAGNSSDNSEDMLYIHGNDIPRMTQMQQNMAMQQHRLGMGPRRDVMNLMMATDDKDAMLDWHANKPSIWELYYGSNRMSQTILKKVRGPHSIMSYPSTRPESDFTLDVPRAEQLRIKMKKEKQFRHRCRIITSFLSLVFFLATVMVVSLILTRGKRMFGSMI